jgi:hypothetical protein
MKSKKNSNLKRAGVEVDALVRSIFREKRIDISIPFRGWSYYAGAFLTGDIWQGKRPSVWEVHPKCADIKGWRFGWRYVGAVWGREKVISSANVRDHRQLPQ